MENIENKDTAVTEETTETTMPVQEEKPAETEQTQPAPKKTRKKKKQEEEEPVPEVEEVLTDENNEAPASVMTRTGDLICSSIHRTLHSTCIPIICDYGQTDSYGRGIEVYTAETEKQAKALLRLLAQTEVTDRKAIGQIPDIFYRMDDKYAEVVNSQKKTDLSKFSIGHVVTGFSMETDTTGIPNALADMAVTPAAANTPAEKTAEPEIQAEETTGHAAGLDTEENKILIDYLLGNANMCAQFLNQTPDALSDNEMVLRGMIMAQIAFTEEQILDQWYALAKKTA